MLDRTPPTATAAQIDRAMSRLLRQAAVQIGGGQAGPAPSAAANIDFLQPQPTPPQPIVIPARPSTSGIIGTGSQFD